MRQINLRICKPSGNHYIEVRQGCIGGRSRVAPRLSYRRMLEPLFDPLNIILLAAAAFVLWRLVGVLGQRTGNEPGLDPLTKPRPVPAKDATAQNDNEPETEEAAKPVWHGMTTEGTDLANGLEAIAKSQTAFSANGFLEGAKLAYEMILEAYAKGDKTALKPLLSREVLDEFSSAIDARVAKGHTAFLQFVAVKSAKIDHAELAGKKARIAVGFVSEMISATRDPSGAAVDGDNKEIREIADHWMFERDVSSRDPNWRLVDTSADRS
jgi:predicted lipid-binding transport protein (Tim44 family)